MDSIKNIILMKYGIHAGESPDAIIKRKQLELEHTGHVFWGYNGTLCHPKTQVQIFLNENRNKQQKTFLLLVKTKSETPPPTTIVYPQAHMYSEDQLMWKPIPSENCVTGSRYAIICKTFDTSNICLDLSLYRNPFGKIPNIRLSDYIGWRRNKSCGRYSEEDIELSVSKFIQVSVVAEIETAVFVQ